MKDSRGIVYSSGLHVLIAVLLIFGLPNFFQRTIELEPVAISVDILPIAAVSNVKPQEKSVEKEEKKPVEKKQVERKAVTESHKEETKPEEKPEPISAKQIVKKIEKKPEKKKPEPKKQDDLASILKSVQDTAKAEEGKKPTQTKTPPNQHEAKSQNYDSSQPLSLSQKDAIVGQIERCWSPPVGAKDAQNLIVVLHVEVAQDGTITKVEPGGNTSRYNSDSFYQAATDSAIRAIHQCSPLKNLPTDKYGTWRDMELSFDPHDM